jgi:predicted transcriptional regulator of viral defense system
LCITRGLEDLLRYTKDNQPPKTTGRQMARLLAVLYDRSLTTFTLKNVEEITELKPDLASSLIKKAVGRGLVTRLKRGLFVIVPQELGSAREYTGEPYVVGRHLAGGAPCFISHASAMEIHRMVTQPQLAVFISSPKRVPNRTIQGTQFRFVLTKPAHFFGTTKHWVTKQEGVDVSDLERTVIDGLRQPEYCGGVTEVAKGLWMRHENMRTGKLVDYALRLGVGAVNRRLGYLLELYAIAPEQDLERLQESLTSTYVSLDPLLPKEGPHLARWRLQVNVPPEELKGVRGT